MDDAKKSNLEFYVLGVFFLLANLVFQLIVIFSFKQLGISNYAALVLTMVMPVNLYTGLFVINYRVRKDMPLSDKRHILPSPKKIIFIILLQLLVSLAVWVVSYKNYPLQAAFLYFTMLFNLFLWLIFLLPAGTFNFLQRRSQRYLNQYALYATLLVVSLTAWPASLYTWYAHNQEITQSVKKEQLYLADALRQRADENQTYFNNLMTLNPPQAYIDSLQLSAGIYTIYQDKVSLTEDITHTRDTNAIYEQFYFSIAKEIGNNYYDPLMIPALQDSAADNGWHWSKTNEADSIQKIAENKKKEKIFFTYHLYAHPTVDSENIITRDTKKALLITSIFPSRYIFIEPSLRGFFLLLLVALIIYGLFRLIRYISYHLFLIKFITGTETNEAAEKKKLLKLFTEFKAYRESIAQPVFLEEKDILELEKEYAQYKLLAASLDEYQLEKRMFETLDQYKNFFDYVWNKFSAKEKFLLLNYVQNGFVNFKNTEAIIHLLQEGIFKIKDEELKIFSVSFRQHVLNQKFSSEMVELKTELRQESTWQSFRVPLLLIILGVALFILITQEQTFQKITAMLTGLTTVFTLLMKFFTDGGGLFSAKK